MTAKLNQIIALIPGKKTQAKQVSEQSYHLLQKKDLFDGLSKRYHPKQEDGDQLPDESKLPQLKVGDLIANVKEALSDMFDVVATQDEANRHAKANVVVDGVTLVEDCPVTHLLFLEKQLVDLATFAGKIPVPDPAEAWQSNGLAGGLSTLPFQTVRTKKVLKNHVKAEATREHPAQVDTFAEDVQVGTYTTIKYTGAMAQTQKTAIINRIRLLQEAVKLAREEANSIQVKPVKEGNKVLDFIFGF